MLRFIHGTKNGVLFTFTGAPMPENEESIKQTLDWIMAAEELRLWVVLVVKTFRLQVFFLALRFYFYKQNIIIKSTKDTQSLTI
jgi:hypothetical protein